MAKTLLQVTQQENLLKPHFNKVIEFAKKSDTIEIDKDVEHKNINKKWAMWLLPALEQLKKLEAEENRNIGRKRKFSEEEDNENQSLVATNFLGSMRNELIQFVTKISKFK